MSTQNQDKTKDTPRLYLIGDVLVLGDALGHRLDTIMGKVDHWNIRTRLQNAGLLDENGEPTSVGQEAFENYLKERKLSAEAEARREILASAPEGSLIDPQNEP